MLQIVRKKLAEDEIQPTGTRYNSDCDCVQQTPDGGTTWIDAPGLDPRSAPGFRLPATTVTDPQCNAAANMVAKLRTFVNFDVANTTIAGLGSALLAGILLFLPGVGIVVDAILIAADVILAITGAAIDSAFSEEVYDAFLCVFFDHIGADGQMTDAQLADMYAAVAAQFDSVVQAVFGAHSSTIGAVGWSNAGVRGESIDADCVGCTVHCFTIDLTASDGSAFGVIPLFSTATWVDGQGWQGAFYDGSDKSDATISWIFPAALEVVAVSAEAYVEAVAGGGGIIRVLNPNTNNYSTDLLTSGDITLPGTSPDFIVSKSVDVNDTAEAMSVDVNCGSADTVVYITRVSVSYTGDEAFGGDNC